MFILELQGFLYIFARITSFIIAVPGFSHKSVPNTTKVALSLILSWIVYLNIPAAPVDGNIVLFMLGALREAIVGISMGFTAKLIFSAIEMAGQHIDFQVGYSMAAIYDPASGAVSSYYGKLFYWMSIMVFFLMNLDHTLLQAMMDSFKVLPPGQISFTNLNLEGILYVFSYSFKIAFSIAAPMLIVLLVTDIVMGLISRTVPEINVFMLGMPLKSMIGMVMFLLLISCFMSNMAGAMGLMNGCLLKIIEMFH